MSGGYRLNGYDAAAVPRGKVFASETLRLVFASGAWESGGAELGFGIRAGIRLLASGKLLSRASVS